jgi:hypothetical protein
VLHLEGNFLATCEALAAAAPGLVELDLSCNRLASLAGLGALRTVAQTLGGSDYASAYAAGTDRGAR